MPATDIDRSFYGAAPELIDPGRWGVTDAGATMVSDVYAFAVLAWEVRMKLAVCFDSPLNEMGVVFRFSLGDLRFPMRVLSRGFIRC